MFRSGIGYDVHPLAKGRKLILGGVKIPYKLGLLGHSDADVLLHAIADALLGAVGKGDIGEHFSNKSSKYKGISSLVILARVRQIVKAAGFKVVNIDCVLIAEEPKINRYKLVMKEKIARALGIVVDQVNVKATTNEGLGFVGRNEGMAAYATALVRAVEH
ncbi:MAG: 2-C-methyl-D-erythritol 2,4-cyclodiphosphate synthase [Candidatus Omnitrophica bacterium]|nr:2-C-methyl-D-erythritol 2,4-cyclodiphosphate synthase [Candidatus Omnitrophota bacterium]